jgi:undecaprenyl-diphosphatase
MIRAALHSVGRRSFDYDAKLAWFIIMGSVPAAAVGFLLQGRFESLFASAYAPLMSGIFLLLTAGLLAGSEVLTRHLTHAHDLRTMSLKDAMVVGSAQIVALLPGVSRSGSTIAAGLTRGLQRDSAARFSFLLGAPVFFGAGLLQLSNALAENRAGVIESAPALVIGFLCSAITGFVAIRFLLAYLRTNSLYPFALYCLVVGLAAIGLAVAPV